MFFAWLNLRLTLKITNKGTKFKKMANNSLKERHPFELNFPFIYDYPNQYNQIERKDNEHYFHHFPVQN